MIITTTIAIIIWNNKNKEGGVSQTVPPTPYTSTLEFISKAMRVRQKGTIQWKWTAFTYIIPTHPPTTSLS